MRTSHYRAWSGDRRAFAQMSSISAIISITQVCKDCGTSFETQEIRKNCLCDECKTKKEGQA